MLVFAPPLIPFHTQAQLPPHISNHPKELIAITMVLWSRSDLPGSALQVDFLTQGCIHVRYGYTSIDMYTIMDIGDYLLICVVIYCYITP